VDYVRHLTLAQWFLAANLILFGLALVGCGTLVTPTPLPITLIAPQQLPTSVFNDPVLRLGQEQYNLVCGHCHGYNGEGQLASTVQNTRELGMNLVPAHDSSGHTWEHPDQLLFRVIAEGIQNPLDQFAMPGFGGGMTDEQITAVIEYMKLWWTPQQRAHQASLTREWARREQELGLTTLTP
jgi:S-disulfanyl-L-cysteine oxidoreductase SoxD